MPTFKHSGDLGDIVYALPTMRALGGGVLMLDPEGGESDPLVVAGTKNRTHLTRERIDVIRSLLLAQDYVDDVVYWNGEKPDFNLDRFRAHLVNRNLADAHLAAFGLPTGERDRPWISAADPIKIPGRDTVIARSVRQQGNFNFWERTMPQIVDRCVYVGLPKEHEIFEYTFEMKVEYRPTADLLELARVIAGGEQFIGNSSLPHSLAEAMKKPLILEVNRVYCPVLFERPGAHYV